MQKECIIEKKLWGEINFLVVEDEEEKEDNARININKIGKQASTKTRKLLIALIVFFVLFFIQCILNKGT